MTKRTLLFALAAAVTLGPAVGCAAEPDTSGATSDATSDAPNARGTDDPVIRVIDEREFAAVLESHRGEVVLVDFWATWCLTCLELFPHTIELQQRFGERGFTVLSVSLDEPHEQAAVAKALRERGAKFETFISRYGSADKSYEVFAIPGGALPHMKLFGRDGKPIATFDSDTDTVDPREIDEAVERLFSEK